MPNGLSVVEFPNWKYLNYGGFMTNNQTPPSCTFCGGATEEQHGTRIGLIFIHSACLVDLEEILSLTEEEPEEIII
jgi:hypothetical protein